MRLEYACFHNLGPFRHFEIDLISLGDARLVAVSGRNGIGKTFTLEAAVAGGSYRKMRTQGKLLDRATARDSYLETRIVSGRRWTIRHMLDAVGRKAESVVIDENGDAAFDGTKVTAFDTWAKANLLAEDVLYSTLFAAQGSGGFLELTSSERISVILQVIGVARLERMAERARKKATVERGKRDALLTRIADARAGAPSPDVASAARADAFDLATVEDDLLKKAREDLAAAEELERSLAGKREVAQAAAAAAAARVEAIGKAREKLIDLEERIRNNRARLAEGEAIRAAAESVPRLRAQIEASERGAAEQDKGAALVRADVSMLEATAADADRRAKEARARIQRASARLKDAPEVDKASLEVPTLRDAAEKAATEVVDKEAALELVRGKRLAGAEERIHGLRCGLDVVAAWDPSQAVSGAIGVAERTLETDDKAVRDSEDAARVGELDAELRAARDKLAAAQRRLSAAERLAARAGEMAAARADIAAAEADEREAQGKAKDAAARAKQRGADLTPLAAAAEAAASQAAAARAALAEAERTAALAEELAKCEARLAVHEPNAAAARADLARLEAEHAGAPVPEAVPAAVDLTLARHAVSQAETRARQAHAALARAEQTLEQALAAADRVDAFEADREVVEADLADYTRLALDLGRDGIQSAEVDSAGAELTELVNDLLHTCHGSRFTVSVETTRLSADGKDQIDDCNVQVIDTVRGRADEARNFSGGERVIISEAMSLGLTMLACRRAGITQPTLVRDESGAALDPENAAVYIAMLRRAADIVGADRVLFVSHSEEVKAMADARIEIPTDTAAQNGKGIAASISDAA